MGQYYKVVNITKKEVLSPRVFGDGAKLLEFGGSGGGTMTALAILLADGNGRGGGDLYMPENHPLAELAGSWSGNQIVVTGDYADEGRFGATPDKTLYEAAKKYKDISLHIMELMCCDKYLCKELLEATRWREDMELCPALVKERKSEIPRATVGNASNPHSRLKQSLNPV